MAPAFPSTSRAAAFGGILLFFLTLPVMLHWTGRPSREEAYRGISERAGGFGFIRREIYEEHSDLDIAFCGNSLLGGAINPDYIESELSRALGRHANVVLLPQSWQGPDMNYYVSRDLLEHRPVKMLVIAAPAWLQHSNQPHVQLFRVIRYGDHPGALDGLDLRYRLAIYADYVLGAPRQALNLLRPNLVDPESETKPEYGTAEGYRGRPFVSHEVIAPPIGTASMIYSSQTSGLFRFTGTPLNPFQLHFILKTVELVRQHGTVLVILHMPSPTEQGSNVVFDRQRMPEAFGPSVYFVGIPSTRLFQYVPDSQFFDYFHDEHLNTNGMNLYSKAITPGLIDIYERNFQTH